ncbi:MAG: hypothetical protein IKH36_01920 [Bacilli bacterium]|nr:hypothetical protein [Bacilli bacterium]
MAKTRLNQSHRNEIKRKIKNYIQNLFNNDEEFKQLLKDEEKIEKVLQEKHDYFTNTTIDITKYLKASNVYGSTDVEDIHYTYYHCILSIECTQTYNCKFSYEYLKDRCSDFLKLDDCDYSMCIYSGRLMHVWLQQSEIWNNFNSKMEELNNKYSEMQTKMYMIVDNCKYLEDVKEYLPIDAIINYINEVLYNCNTFISCITSEDLSLVKDFINNNKKDA